MQIWHRAAVLFRGLADPTRLAILRLLTDGETRVVDLAGQLGMAQSTVSAESHYVLDGILGTETDLPIHEHGTDTHGATLANSALFDRVGKQLSPRIGDVGKITLYRTGPRTWRSWLSPLSWHPFLPRSQLRRISSAPTPSTEG